MGAHLIAMDFMRIATVFLLCFGCAFSLSPQKDGGDYSIDKQLKAAYDDGKKDGQRGQKSFGISEEQRRQKEAKAKEEATAEATKKLKATQDEADAMEKDAEKKLKAAQ